MVYAEYLTSDADASCRLVLKEAWRVFWECLAARTKRNFPSEGKKVLFLKFLRVVGNQVTKAFH